MDNKSKLIDMVKERHVYYKDTFATPCGKKVIKDLEASCYIHRSTITDQSSVDPYLLGFREGQRAVVLKINNYRDDECLKKMGVDPLDKEPEQ